MDRDHLVDRAAATLALRPNAGMDELAAAAQISRATLFRRFPSREALVAEVLQRAATVYVGAVDGAAPDDGPPAEALRRVVRALAALAPTHGLLLLQPLPERLEAELLEQVRGTDERIEALVRRGQDAGAFRVDLPAAWVLTAVTWLVVGAADGLRLGVLPPADVERLVSETVLGALRREA